MCLHQIVIHCDNELNNNHSAASSQTFFKLNVFFSVDWVMIVQVEHDFEPKQLEKINIPF